jgi:hypothetical protein
MSAIPRKQATVNQKYSLHFTRDRIMQQKICENGKEKYDSTQEGQNSDVNITNNNFLNKNKFFFIKRN